jgi:hypothetical protein
VRSPRPTAAPRTDLVENPPDASALVESLRAFGYRYDAAIEDVIDNSVTAGARRVDVVMSWSGRDSTVTIVDDGHGMDLDELHQAMRLGARSPLEEREDHDLGRFGLGMKTASFSQSRRLTVATRRAGGELHVAVWDLDVIRDTGRWSMGTVATEQAAGIIADRLGDRGTVVVWEKLDRLVGDVGEGDPAAREAFFGRVAELASALGVTYHRRLVGANAVRLSVNGEGVVAWDPFLLAHPSTQVFPTEELPTGDGRRIPVTAHVLPHHSALDHEAHVDAGGVKGWNAHQGLFVYRNRRLIVDGGWLDLGYRQEDHFKLARVRVDLSNGDDHAWQIDVRKEQAKVPDSLRDDLRRVARAARNRAEAVYRHRGTVISGRTEADRVFVWQEKRLHGRVSWRVNRNHPLVEELSRRAGKKRVSNLLRLVEETVPRASIALEQSRDPESEGEPFAGVSKTGLQALVRDLYEAVFAGAQDPEAALRQLGSLQPCLSQPDLLAHLKDDLEAESGS